MAARRLMIAMLVLLGIALITVTLAPVPGRDTTSSTTTTPTTEVTAETGRLIERAIPPAPDEPELIRVAVGDQLRLTVRVREPDLVELEGLGQLADADPYAPAVFDLRPVEPGIHAVRLQQADRVVGRIEVEAPARPEPARGPA